MKASLMPAKTVVTKQPVSAEEEGKRKRFTGRRIVILDKSMKSSAIEKRAGTVSLKMANIKDYKSFSGSLAVSKALSEADGIVFDKLKVAVVNEINTEQVNRLTASRLSNRSFLASEPERYVYALAKKRKSSVIYDDDEEATWGIQAVNAFNSSFTGKDVRVAILDSGISQKHSDFKGRKIETKSFIPRQGVEDGYGHGTHCAGIACGNISKQKEFRYGVAGDANLFVGKVLDNDGEGEDRFVLAGIEWALENECKVISMSLGSAVEPGESYYISYETIANRALESGAIVIAAAGNDSERSDGIISPVNHPANCPSIMSVAALDKNLKIADFSCAGTRKKGGQIDIAGPGVDIFSASVRNTYEIMSGTSMATPFVAGMAALFWEEFPRATAGEIWMKLTQAAKRLNLKSSDVGAGLVFYP